MQMPAAAEQVEAEVRGAARAIESLLALIDDLQAEPQKLADAVSDGAAGPDGASSSAAAGTPGEAGQGCPKPELVAIPDVETLLARAGIDQEAVSQALRLVGELDPARSIVAGIVEAKADLVTSDAVVILQALATRGPGGPIDADQSEARRAQRVVRALALLRQIEAIRDDELPATSSLLVTISRQTFLARQAAIEADKLAREKEMIERKLAAMISEIAFLDAAAERAAAGERTGAVRRYAQSWARGRAQERIADQALEEIERGAWLARERAAIAAQFDLIDPALSELQAYAEGGITAELVARYLNVLGIGAIAYGVN